jgi:cytochrome c oxidase subunit IV
MKAMYFHQQRNRIIWIVVAVILIVVIIFGVVVVMNMRGTPILDVSNVSLNPTTININSNATLSFTIKNNDESNQHDITVRFNVTSVTFYINSLSLYRDYYGVQYYNIQLQSLQESTYRFGVTGTLTGGASTSTYSIRLNFYDENGTKFDSETQSLTVNP